MSVLLSAAACIVRKVLEPIGRTSSERLRQYEGISDEEAPDKVGPNSVATILPERRR
jgi:hypothetical protein